MPRKQLKEAQRKRDEARTLLGKTLRNNAIERTKQQEHRAAVKEDERDRRLRRDRQRKLYNNSDHK